MRTGTRKARAASIPSNPALGVPALTRSGRNRRSARVTAASATTSARGDGARAIGTATKRAPSAAHWASTSSDGLDRNDTSAPAARRAASWPA